MEAHRIPTAVHNGLITVHTRTPAGVPLVFDLDSGGAMLLSPAALARTGLTARQERADWGEEVTAVDVPFDLTTQVPSPTAAFMVRDLPPWIQGDGMLGQLWHADRVWTYDYPAGRLWVGDAVGQGPRRLGHTIPLGLPAPSRTGEPQAVQERHPSDAGWLTWC